MESERHLMPRCGAQLKMPIGEHALAFPPLCQRLVLSEEFVLMLLQMSCRGSRSKNSRRSLCGVEILFGLIAALALSGCATTLPSMYYRLTVIVDTPEGRRSGSSVLEVRASYSSAFPGPETQGITTLIRGEAAAVKLPDGQYVFAVRKWGTPEGGLPMLLHTFADQIPPVTAIAGDEWYRQRMDQIRALAKARGVRAVKPADYPVLVRFDDLRKPATIHAMEARPGDIVAPGARLVGMTLEMTGGPETHTIRSILPWVGRRDLGYLDPQIRKDNARDRPEYRYIGEDEFEL